MEIQLFDGKLDFLLKGNTLMSLCVEEDDDDDDFDEIGILRTSYKDVA